MLTDQETLKNIIVAKEAQIKKDQAALRLHKEMLKKLQPKKAFIETQIGRGIFKTLAWISKPGVTLNNLSHKVIQDPKTYRQVQLLADSEKIRIKYENLLFQSKKPLKFKSDKDPKRTSILIKLMNCVCELEAQAQLAKDDMREKLTAEAYKMNNLILDIRPLSKEDEKKQEELKQNLGEIFNQAVSDIQTSCTA